MGPLKHAERRWRNPKMVLRNSISLSCCVIIANRVSSYFVGAFDIVFGLLFASSGRPVWLVAVLGLVEVLVLGVLGGWVAARLLMLLWGILGGDAPPAAAAAV